MKKMIFAVLLVVVFLAGACATTLTPTGKEASSVIVESPPILVMDSKFVFQETNLVTGKVTRSYTLVIKEKKDYERKPAYWVDTTGGKGESFDIYDMNLNWVAFIKGGKEQTSASPCIKIFSWPLKVGGRWQTFYDYWDRSRGSSYRGESEVVSVESYEEVKILAGTFRAFKIVREISTFKETNWYSPSVGMIIKRQRERTAQNYLGYSRWLVELTEYGIPDKTKP